MALCFCILGPFIAYFYARFPETDRYYPLWANDLFPPAGPVATNYSITIYKLDGKTFENGVDFFKIFPVTLGRFSPSVAIAQLGNAFESGDPDKYKVAKTKFEMQALRGIDSGYYTISKVTWSPIERFNTGRILEDNKLTDVHFGKD